MRLLIDSGLAGLVCFGLALSLCLVNAYKRAHSEQARLYVDILLVVTSAYVTSNLSTEFFLVTRISVPFLILFGLLYNHIRQPDGSTAFGRETGHPVAGRAGVAR